MHEGPVLALLDLQAEEEGQLAHHAHLELPAHQHRKFCNKGVGGPTEYNVININLHNQCVTPLPKQEQGLVHRSHLKPLTQQKGLQSIIPCSRGLLKPIQSFVQLVYMVGVFGMLKTWGLSNINLFLNKPIEEGALHIHLIELETLGSSES